MYLCDFSVPKCSVGLGMGGISGAHIDVKENQLETTRRFNQGREPKFIAYRVRL